MDYTTIKFIGIKLPLTNSQYGYFNPSTVTLNQVKSNLQNLILTRKGERLMQPTFGCNIYNYLFENIDNIQIEENIQDMIQTTISMWMPYIKIKYINVIVENANIDNHELKIKIGFALNDLLEDELRLQIMSGE